LSAEDDVLIARRQAWSLGSEHPLFASGVLRCGGMKKSLTLKNVSAFLNRFPVAGITGSVDGQPVLPLGIGRSIGENSGIDDS